MEASTRPGWYYRILYAWPPYYFINLQVIFGLVGASAEPRAAGARGAISHGVFRITVLFKPDTPTARSSGARELKRAGSARVHFCNRENMQPAKQRAHRTESQCKSDFGGNTISFKVPHFACEYRVLVCVCALETDKNEKIYDRMLSTSWNKLDDDENCMKHKKLKNEWE